MNPSLSVKWNAVGQTSSYNKSNTRLARRVSDRKGSPRGGMFWGASAKRSDPSSQSESGPSDPEDGWGRSKRSEKRSRRGRRATESKKNKSWFGGLVGSAEPSTRKKSGKKSKRSKTKTRASCIRGQSKPWGKIMLATLMCIYLMSFANVLYFDRPSGFQSVPTGSSSRGESRDDSKKAPVRVAENNTSAGGNTSQNLQETASHQSTGTTNVNSEGGSNNEGGSNPLGSGAANPRSREMKESSSSDSHSSDTNQPSKELAKHPMNRNMEDLQVPGNVGALSSDAVKDYYRKLAKAYLTTFTGGIHRQMYFDILRRRTYALTPPGANKGVQTILFQVIDKKVYMMDPYEVPRNSKPFYRTRINQVIWLLSKLCHEGRIKNTEFIMAIHDCVQTVNKPHTYRGAHYEESNPAFTIVSCNFSDNVPFPMWEGTKHRDGGFQGWDENMKKYAEDDIPWKQKQDRAVFRGGNRPSMYFKNKTDADSRCHDVGRTRLLFLSQQQPDVLDVSIGGSCGGKHESLHRMDARAQHKFKYILYAEGNCMWADRSKQHVFGPSAMIKQETPCGQFFEPLLRPNTHYIPTDFFFTDTIDKIKWARQNDEIAHQIVKNANEFASNFLSLKGIETYVEVLLEEYTALLVEPDVKLENGAIDVTDKEV